MIDRIVDISYVQQVRRVGAVDKSLGMIAVIEVFLYLFGLPFQEGDMTGIEFLVEAHFRHPGGDAVCESYKGVVFDRKPIDQLAREDDLEDIVVVAYDHLVVYEIVEDGDVLVQNAMVGDRSDLKSILPVKGMSVP